MLENVWETDETKSVMQLEEKDFNLCDFALFLAVMKNEAAHRNVLSIITGEPDLELQEVHVEEVVLNKSGQRAIRLDARATDTSGRHFATEMQNDTEKDDVRRRSRFYQGLLDTPLLKAGKETRYKHLPPTIITFITQKDIFGKGLAKYTFTEQCEEIKGLHLEDGTTKLFLNMSSKNGEPVLVSLLQYMKHTTLENPEILVKDERLTQLNEIVTEVKQSEEWEAVKMSILSIGLERGEQIGIERGMAKGMIRGISKSILDLLEENGPVSEKTRQMILSETDTERLSVWLKKAAKSDSEADFLNKIEG